MNNLPPDGLLSGSSEDPEGEQEEVASPELVEAAQQMAQRMQAQQAWRPGCVPCLNGHKIAIAELAAKLKAVGLVPGDERFNQAMQAAAQAGAMYAQNPMAPGLNGQHPDMIPPVRSADIIVNGTTCCVVCFQAQKTTSLLQAGSGWSPSR